MSDSSTFHVRVTPRASRNSVTVQDEGTLKVSVTEAPVDGGANKAVCELIARQVRIRKGAVSVVKGHTSRDKTILVEGMSAEEVVQRLREKR